VIELIDPLKTLVWVLSHGPQNHFLDVYRQIWPFKPGAGYASNRRRLSGHHFIKQYPQGINIGPLVNGPALNLFRTQIDVFPLAHIYTLGIAKIG
jgi:hypothetical protein